jgi:FkbM family methyltransferase
MITKLTDGTKVHCLKKPEAKMLDHHVEGYLQHGIVIKENDVVFDVGANVGVFGVRVLQKAPNVQVFCFEPIPQIANVLSKNAEMHGQGKMTVIQKGVSDKPQQAVFTYFPNTPALSTLHPEQWDNNPGSFKNAVKSTMKNPPVNMKWMKWIPTSFSGIIAAYLVRGRQVIHCELTTLSDVIKEKGLDKIDLLKIDCEGAEWAVLMGIQAEDWYKIKALVIEVHDVDDRLKNTQHLLEKHGFAKQVIEQESGLENSKMYNLFATR